MEKNKKKFPSQKSLTELIDFFDNQDLGDYLDDFEEVSFQVDIHRKTYYFKLDEDLVEKITRIAAARNVSSNKLINQWIRESLVKV